MAMARKGVLNVMQKLGSGTKLACHGFGQQNSRALSNHHRRLHISSAIQIFGRKSNSQPIGRLYTTESAKKASSPEILSKLFPQTAANVDEETERERKRKEEEEAKENEKAWKRMKIGFAVFGGSGIALAIWAVYEFGKPEVDVEGQVIEDEFSKSPVIQQYIQRMWKSMNYYQKMIQEPSRDKLLPDPLKHPYIQPPYTLVLEMKDVLVHPDWTYQTGWRFKKRPGVDHFLQECAKHFEIVVFTAEQGMTVFPILDALDPNGYIMYRLVRDATHFVDGHHVKNLDNLNRDLSKVIVVDWDQNATKLHPDNTFNIARWLGNDDDTQLLDLISFLKTLASAEVEDVRDVLHYYRQFDDPIAQFRENQRLLLEQMQEKEREEQTKSKPIVKKWTPSFLGRSS
ncbi:mitochondrial import inner membrane translocase subunit TIM50-C-like [Zeugodacus cucurbitae]|uniref:mitochondrial import inner membrane translocase subunit TIM50-C-like n=1 Tax=Zeugodacus cucurbitae TaxID=28588 RepID=UPI0005969CA0|nr:mitochondrial import inner membrane translocase subunit TIM50-C-like [Zeugodacus cucurbitae]XP_011183366.1 mitochondrial import inner membrane translocase subunit TIM50-C-like [Zeugodacus cucurbitae]